MPKKEKNFSAGEVIFKQGEPCRFVYTILEGRVEMYYEVSGKARVLATKVEDDMLGANCVLDGTYDTSARAVNNVVLAVQEADEYIAKLQRSGELSPLVKSTSLGEASETAEDEGDDFNFDFDAEFEENVEEEPSFSKRPSLAGRKSTALSLTRPTKGVFGEEQEEKKESSKQAVVKVEKPRPQKPVKTDEPHILPADIKRAPIKEWLLEGMYEEQPSFGTVVLLASVAGDDNDECRRMIYQALRQVPDLKIKVVDTAVNDSNPQRAAMKMRSWMKQHLADVGLYATLDAAGRLMEFHAVRAALPNDPRSSFLKAGSRFYLPVDMKEEHRALLKIFTVAAIVPTRLEHEQLLRLFLPSAVREAAPFGLKPMTGLNDEEQAANLAYFGTVLSLAAVLKPTGEDRARASEAYEAALNLMPPTAPEYVFVNRQLGLLHQIAAEKKQDIQGLKKAEETFVAAVSSVSPSVQPETWGDLKIRIGNVRQKIASQTGNGEDFASAMTAYREALGRLKPSVHIEKWADAVNGLARTMQEFGAHSPKTTLLEKSVELYERELSVIDKDRFPMLWASASNNLASALFMLFEKTDNSDLLRRAVEVFSGALAVYNRMGADRMAAVANNNLHHAEKTLSKLERELEEKKNWLDDILEEAPVEEEPLVFEKIAVFEELDDEEE